MKWVFQDTPPLPVLIINCGENVVGISFDKSTFYWLFGDLITKPVNISVGQGIKYLVHLVPDKSNSSRW